MQVVFERGACLEHGCAYGRDLGITAGRPELVYPPWYGIGLAACNFIFIWFMFAQDFGRGLYECAVLGRHCCCVS